MGKQDSLFVCKMVRNNTLIWNNKIFGWYVIPLSVLLIQEKRYKIGQSLMALLALLRMGKVE